MVRTRSREIIGASIMIALIIGVIALTSFISKSVFLKLNTEEEDSKYVLEDIVSNDLPVNTEVKNTILKPFSNNDISVEINFYDHNQDDERNELSLILYENTYMPSTGILYSSENTFDVKSIYAGKVEEIKDDSTLGKIITIKHNNNLISKYSSIDNITVKEGEEIEAGTIIGTSSSNKITDKQNTLLIELIHNGEYVNPENYYNKTLEEVE